MTREEFVRQIKCCGQSIIDNADDIYNRFEYPTRGIRIEIEVTKDGAPCITVVNAFIPECFLIGMNNR